MMAWISTLAKAVAPTQSECSDSVDFAESLAAESGAHLGGLSFVGGGLPFADDVDQRAREFRGMCDLSTDRPQADNLADGSADRDGKPPVSIFTLAAGWMFPEDSVESEDSLGKAGHCKEDRAEAAIQKMLARGRATTLERALICATSTDSLDIL